MVRIPLCTDEQVAVHAEKHADVILIIAIGFINVDLIPIEHDNCPRRGDITGPIVLIPPLLLEELLEACEEAIDWLETQHSLIEAVSLPNYLQQQIGDGD